MFFTSSELKKYTKLEVDTSTLESNCMKCKLDQGCKNPRIEVSGMGEKGILIITNTPSSSDTRYNSVLSGEDGDYLKKELLKHDIVLNRDCYKISAIRCFTTEVVKKQKTTMCSPYIHKLIYELKPKLVLVLGGMGIWSLFPDFGDKDPWQRWRGLMVRDYKFQTHIFTASSPEFIVERENDIHRRLLFERDLKSCFDQFKDLPSADVEPEYEKRVTKLTDFKQVIDKLTYIKNEVDKLYFDYETTGLVPFIKGHKTASIGFAYNSKEAFALPLEFNNYWTSKELQQIKELWVDILKDRKIKKLSHNSFEDLWSFGMFGVRTYTYWDTLLGAHLLDNRSNFCGLKFQTMINFGIRPYDEHMSKYLKSKNSPFNTIEKAPLHDLLIYNGLDCLFGMKLYEKQKSIMLRTSRLLDAMRFFMRGIHSMVTLQINGIKLKDGYYDGIEKELDDIVEEKMRVLLQRPEAIEFKKRYGRELDVNKNADLGKVLYDILNLPKVYTDKGNLKTDKATTANFKADFINTLNDKNKYGNIKSKYIGQIKRSVVNGKLHPSFNLHVPVSYRSSASAPSWQNFPKRDKEVKRYIRNGVVPRYNRVLSEIDFSGAEVCVSAAYHQDPTFINYLVDPTTDMHRDCFSMDTKILTEGGFKFYSEIQEGDKVGQFNPETDKIEYVVPTARIYKDYSGDMCYLRSNYIDTLTTPNHRMYLKKLNEEYAIVKAKDIVKMSYYARTGADLSEVQESGDFYFPPVYGTGYNSTKKYHDEFTIKSDDMFELLGYLITDGHFKYHKQVAYRISLSQIKEPHRTKMKSCIDRIKSYTNFKFHEEKNKWSMSNKSFCSWLISNFTDNKIDRRIPDFIKNAPTRQLKLFFDGCMLGDGLTQGSRYSSNFYTPSRNMVEDFQFISMRLGYSTRFVKCPLKGGRTVQVYNISIKFKDECHVKGREEYYGTEHYEGKVFCFTVPTGLLVTQRNNKISVQGNCAIDIYQLDNNELTHPNMTKEEKSRAGELRQSVKGFFVFAQLYGDWYGSCAESIWYQNVAKEGLVLPDGTPLRDHMASKGIKTLEDLTEVCKVAEDIMWNERFPVYTQWKHDTTQFYRKHGYIENKQGFRFTGYMDWKQCCNFPIQSSSFHLLLHVIRKIDDYLVQKKMKTKLVGQIHDSIIADIYLPELDEYLYIANKFISQLKADHPWLVVPVEMDAEISLPSRYGGCFTNLYEVPSSGIGNINLTEVYKSALKEKKISQIDVFKITSQVKSFDK